jgi:hypothetical protein
VSNDPNLHAKTRSTIRLGLADLLEADRDLDAKGALTVVLRVSGVLRGGAPAASLARSARK